jgi:hypothetical protein
LGFLDLTASLFLGAFVIQISQLYIATSPVVPCFLAPSLDDTPRTFQERDVCPLVQRFSQSVPLKKAHQAMFSFWRNSAKWRFSFQIGKIVVLFNFMVAKFRKENLKILKIARFCSKFQQVAKNIEGC